MSWLPKPPSYPSSYRSWFTELGNECFQVKVLPLMKEYLDMDKVKCIRKENPTGIVYEDLYQVFTDSRMTENSKPISRSNLKEMEKEVQFLGTCEYGILFDGEVVSDPYDMDIVASNGFSCLLTPDEVKKYKVATCWDSTNYLKSKFPELRTIFLEIRGEDGMMTHTFCVLETQGSCYWLEGSWKDQIGIHKHQSLEECLDHITRWLVIDSEDIGDDYTAEARDYETYGEEKISDEEFLDRCHDGPVIWRKTTENND